MQTLTEKAQFEALRFRCRRGMKELEIWLNAYLNEHYSDASPADQQAFVCLLDYEDDRLFDLLKSGLSVDGVIASQK